jgi:hypothetical protein
VKKIFTITAAILLAATVIELLSEGRIFGDLESIDIKRIKTFSQF